MRNAYKKIQKGTKADSNLPQDRIERLEDIGFKWKGVNYDEAFVNHCRELIAFKEEFGHCNVPHKFSNNQSLGHLCNNMISAYQKIQKGMKVDSNLPHDRIERLEDLASNGKS
jgi:hypothetical protein